MKPSYTTDTATMVQTKGFTLIELMTVIAIVVLLMAMSLPIMRRMQVSARRVKCMTNMRQIGQAVILYAEDHGDSLPRTRHTAGATESWIFTLAPYLGEMDSIRVSPADPQAAERLRRRSTSYILNDIVVDPLVDPFGNPLPGGYGRLGLITAPTTTLLAVIISDDRGTGPANDHTHARTWTSFDRFLADAEPDRHRVGARDPSRTRGNAPYLYVDGSVRVHEAEDIKTQFDAGRNIGEPGLAP